MTTQNPAAPQTAPQAQTPQASNQTDSIKEGTYKAKIIAGSQQLSTGTTPGVLKLVLDLDVPALGRSVQTFMHLSPDAKEGTKARLKAAGWDGVKITELKGVDQNEIDIRIYYDTYNNKRQMKVEILSGGRYTVPTNEQMPAAEFEARFAAMEGRQAPPNGGSTPGAPPPPF